MHSVVREFPYSIQIGCTVATAGGQDQHGVEASPESPSAVWTEAEAGAEAKTVQKAIVTEKPVTARRSPAHSMLPTILEERRRLGQVIAKVAVPPESEEDEELEEQPTRRPIRITVVSLSGKELFSDVLDPCLTIRELKSHMRELIGQPGSVKLVCGTEILQPDDVKLRTFIGHVSAATITLTHCAPMTCSELNIGFGTIVVESSETAAPFS
jgi:hypothetical protein